MEICLYSLAHYFSGAHCRGSVSGLCMPCGFTIQACLRLEKFFGEERVPVMLVLKFPPSLLHVLFPDMCCMHLKVYDSALRPIEITHISRSDSCQKVCAEICTLRWQG